MKKIKKFCLTLKCNCQNDMLLFSMESLLFYFSFHFLVRIKTNNSQLLFQVWLLPRPLPQHPWAPVLLQLCPRDCCPGISGLSLKQICIMLAQKDLFHLPKAKEVLDSHQILSRVPRALHPRAALVHFIICHTTWNCMKSLKGLMLTIR